jgi:hypothetical protein
MYHGAVPLETAQAAILPPSITAASPKSTAS